MPEARKTPAKNPLGKQLFSAVCAVRSGLGRGLGRPVAAALCAALLIASPSWAGRTHRVAPRDSLWSIAKRYSLPVAALRAANQLPSDRIRVGQRLRLPDAVDTPSAILAAARPTLAHGAVVLAGSTDATTAPPMPLVPPETSPGAESFDDPFGDERQAPSRVAERAESDAQAAVPAWVMQRPSVAEPANDPRTTDPVAPRRAHPSTDLGGYGSWSASSRLGQLLLPEASPFDSGGGFQLVVHFHGREPFRRQWVGTMQRAVLLSIDLGISDRSYADAFADPLELERLITSVEQDVARRYGKHAARVHHVTLSAWGAGYGAIGAILNQPEAEARVDAAVLLDGLHVALTDGTIDGAAMAPYVKFARRAARGERFFFVSHSAIGADRLASTTQTARYLIWKVDGEPLAATPRDADPPGMELTTSFSKAGFQVRGFRGASQGDHVAHLGLASAVLRRYVRDAVRPAPSADRAD